MKLGSRVKMTKKFKEQLQNNGSREHVEEFGRCVGTVVEIDIDATVKWESSNNLKYHYSISSLEIIV